MAKNSFINVEFCSQSNLINLRNLWLEKLSRGTNPAESVDRDTEKLRHVFQFHSVKKARIMLKEFVVTLLGRQLQPLDEQMAQQNIALLMD